MVPALLRTQRPVFRCLARRFYLHRTFPIIHHSSAPPYLMRRVNLQPALEQAAPGSAREHRVAPALARLG
jgi:hypothetical protein